MLLLYVCCLFVLSQAQSTGRIVGGVETTIERRPFQALVQFDGHFHCGGAIIAPQVVLTAGHCLFEPAAWLYSVRVGSTSRSTGGQVLQASEVLIHENYSTWNGNFDAGLIFLSAKVVFSERAQVVRLASVAEVIPDGAQTVVSGWGDIDVSRAGKF